MDVYIKVIGALPKSGAGVGARSWLCCDWPIHIRGQGLAKGQFYEGVLHSPKLTQLLPQNKLYCSTEIVFT